jgi:hypothetical protein
MKGTLRIHGSNLLDHCKLVQVSNGRKATLALELSESGCRAGKQGEGAYGRALACEYVGDEYNPSYNAAYLSDFAKLAGVLELSAHDHDYPALIESPDLPQWTGVLMPIRGTGQPLPRIAAQSGPEPVADIPAPDSAADTPPIGEIEPMPDSTPPIAAIQPEPDSAESIPLPTDARARGLRTERAAIEAERDARAHAKRLRLIRSYLAMRRRHAAMEASYDSMGKAWKEKQYSEQEAQGELHRAKLQIARLNADLANSQPIAPADDVAAIKANAERLERLLYDAGQRESSFKRANAESRDERDNARRVLADTIQRADSERATMQAAIDRGAVAIETLALRMAEMEQGMARDDMRRAA